MIWVIGDIHGMFDPLKRLMTAIHLYEKKDDPVEKIIFLGDYIDHGPSSKEVIDFILSIKYKTVLLAGNHEDMALRFINQDKRYKKQWGNQWFTNGGVDTYQSIYARSKNDKSDILDFVNSCRNNFKLKRPDSDLTSADYEGLELPHKYVKFFQRLKYSHRETFEYNGKKLGFSFFHGLPRMDQPLSQQRIKTYQAYNKYIYRKGQYVNYTTAERMFEEEKMYNKKPYLSLDDSFLWGRDYSFRWGYGPDVIIHGHTPVSTLPYHFKDNVRGIVAERFGTQFTNFHPDLCLPFIFSRGEEASYQFDNFHKTDLEWLKEKTQRYNSYSGAKLPLILDYNLFKALQNKKTFLYDCGKNGRAEAINIDTGAANGLALTALGLSKEGIKNGQFELLTALTSGNQRALRLPLKRVIKISKFEVGKYERLSDGLKWATPSKYDPLKEKGEDDDY